MTTVPPPPSRPPVSDRWHSRDFPLLLEVARALDARTAIDAQALADDLQMSMADVDSAWHALREAGYLRTLNRPRRLGDGAMSALELTERGRRAVGLWPSEKAADTLVDLLRQAEDLTDDPEEKTLIRRAAGALGSVSRDVLTDVVAAIARQQMGV